MSSALELTDQEINELISKHFPYKEIRNIQQEAIFKIIKAIVNINKKYFILECPTGGGKSAIADIDNSILLNYLVKNGFKTDSSLNQANPKWRYFTIDEDKIISQIATSDYIDSQKYMQFGDYNLILASKLLDLDSNLDFSEQSTLISILPNQGIDNILSKLK